MRMQEIHGNVFSLTLGVCAFYDYNRQVLAIEVDTNLNIGRVIRTLERMVAWRGKPSQVWIDSGSKLGPSYYKGGLWVKSVKLDFIQPVSPYKSDYLERLQTLLIKSK